MASDLSEAELERYSAQIERIGVAGQLRLKNARAIVIGAGPAGSTAAAHLASCGVGYVAVADGGATSARDLCGQLLLYTPDLGANRADAVVAKLGVLNPTVHAESYPVDLEEHNAAAILIGHDVAVDGAAAAGELLPAACDEVGVELVRADGADVAAGALAGQAAIELLAAGVSTAEGVR